MKNKRTLKTANLLKRAGETIRRQLNAGLYRINSNPRRFARLTRTGHHVRRQCMAGKYRHASKSGMFASFAALALATATVLASLRRVLVRRRRRWREAASVPDKRVCVEAPLALVRQRHRAGRIVLACLKFHAESEATPVHGVGPHRRIMCHRCCSALLARRRNA
jgi:hypothetical protein